MSEMAMIEAVAELVPMGSRVLDLGCGDGELGTAGLLGRRRSDRCDCRYGHAAGGLPRGGRCGTRGQVAGCDHAGRRGTGPQQPRQPHHHPVRALHVSDVLGR